MSVVISHILPEKGTSFSPLFEYDIKTYENDNKYYLVVNAGNDSYYLGGGGINGAFSSAISDISPDEHSFLQSQLSKVDMTSDDGEAVPLKMSSEFSDSIRCCGMIYAVGPNKCGESLNVDETNEFLFKIKRTGFEIVKCALLYYPKYAEKITTIKIPLISASIFKPSEIHIRVKSINEDGDEIFSTKKIQSPYIQLLIYRELIKGIIVALNDTSSNIKNIEIYHDPSFSQIPKITDLIKSSLAFNFTYV
jgi:hypothetical protein